MIQQVQRHNLYHKPSHPYRTRHLPEHKYVVRRLTNMNVVQVNYVIARHGDSVFFHDVKLTMVGVLTGLLMAAVWKMTVVLELLIFVNV